MNSKLSGQTFTFKEQLRGMLEIGMISEGAFLL